jgi:hypothetical protein
MDANAKYVVIMGIWIDGLFMELRIYIKILYLSFKYLFYCDVFFLMLVSRQSLLYQYSATTALQHNRPKYGTRIVILDKW